jgi:hypothetical protein
MGRVKKSWGYAWHCAGYHPKWMIDPAVKVPVVVRLIKAVFYKIGVLK